MLGGLVIKRKTKQKVLREGPVWFYVVPISVVGVQCARGTQEGVAVILGAMMSVFVLARLATLGAKKQDFTVLLGEESI